MPANDVTRDMFEIAERPRERTMLKPLEGTLVFEEGQIAAADRLHEIDHV